MAAAAAEKEAKLERFLQWLQANGGQLRGCSIKYCGPSKGFGVFSSHAAGSAPDGNGVLMVVPLDLAITPMRVLQDASLGSRCAEMFKEGHVDDRFLMTLFLLVERLRRNSPWKPYIDMLPSTFSNPLWFSEDELSELKGTTLYRATLLQKKKLQALFNEKVRSLVEEILHLDGEVEGGSIVQFEDFLWANSVFWTRALSIPFPHSYVFPSPVGEETSSCCDSNLTPSHVSTETSAYDKDGRAEATLVVAANDKCAEESSSVKGDTVWVEGLIPGIDFCNHGLQVSTIWEVDKTGAMSRVPFSMYLISGYFLNPRLMYNANAHVDAEVLQGTLRVIGRLSRTQDKRLQAEVEMTSYRMKSETYSDSQLQYAVGRVSPAEPNVLKVEQEIFISYGNKGNEELLYLYGFVIENNPDDYLMVHYPVEALQNVPFADPKAHLLETQKAELRCLLSKSLLDHGFFSRKLIQGSDRNNNPQSQHYSYSWSGQRKVPPYLNKLIFPEEFLSALRILSLQEHELIQVSSLLEELVGSEQRQPSGKDVQAAVWEASGDLGALQLLVDLLRTKMMELEEGSGTEACDVELLEKFHVVESHEENERCDRIKDQEKQMNRNRWSSVIYRQGQKQLTSLFLKEAEHALELCSNELP